MATPEIPKRSVSQMPLGDVHQEATLTDGLASEPVRKLLSNDAVKTYVSSLADLGCSAIDIQRNSKKFRQTGARRQVAVAYSTRIAAAALKGNGNGKRKK